MVQVQFNAMIVPSADGKMRFWRNTSIANLPDGNSAILRCGCDGTLGHEWDEDLDNGFRPLGLIRASSTTANVGLYLLDYGTTCGQHDATHHLTLYRHPPTLRGALVFGAGTINWSWGLDAQHDRDPNFKDVPPSIPEIAMQQATVNLFADMYVQPRTPSAGSRSSNGFDRFHAPHVGNYLTTQWWNRSYGIGGFDHRHGCGHRGSRWRHRSIG
jgi:hypothetical protein